MTVQHLMCSTWTRTGMQETQRDWVHGRLEMLEGQMGGLVDGGIDDRYRVKGPAKETHPGPETRVNSAPDQLKQPVPKQKN